jgi:hypothetical protein
MRSLDRVFDWIRAASAYRWFWLGGPLLLYSWTLTGPFLSDDLHLLLKSERYARGESHKLELYRFAKSDEEWNTLRDRGTCPWWLPETGRLDFFRPVSEWLFYAGARWFGRNPLGHRLISLAVFALALCAVHWMMREASQDRIRAGAATFFFGISQTVAPPVTWICNRQDLLVVVGVAVAAGAYWAARNRPRAWLLPVAAAAYGVALLSKEMAVGLCAVLVGSELRERRRSASRTARPLNAAMTGIVVVMTVVYLAYYQATRPWAFDLNGADGSPTQLSSNWPLSLLLYASVWTLGFPIDVHFVLTHVQTLAVAAAGGVLAVVAVMYLHRSTRGDRAAVFFALWAICFILPGLRGLMPSTRTLCIATIGWTYLLVGLILPSREGDSVIPRPLRHWYYAANGIVSVCCAIGTVLFMNRAEAEARRKVEEMVAACSPPLRPGHTLIVAHSQSTAAQSSIENLCAADRLEFLTGHRDTALIHLLPSDVDAALSVQDEHSLVLAAKSTSLFGSALHQRTLPNNWTPRTGDAFHVRDFTACIEEVRQPNFVAALRVRFNDPLTCDRLHFYPPQFAGLVKAKAAGPDQSIAQAKGF